VPFTFREVNPLPQAYSTTAPFSRLVPWVRWSHTRMYVTFDCAAPNISTGWPDSIASHYRSPLRSLRHLCSRPVCSRLDSLDTAQPLTVPLAYSTRRPKSLLIPHLTEIISLQMLPYHRNRLAIPVGPLNAPRLPVGTMTYCVDGEFIPG